MQKIDQKEHLQRLKKLNAILADIAVHANEQSQYRCPYKNRFDECTAGFGCRNKRPSKEPGKRPICAGDDKLDYRSAWETEVPDEPSNGAGSKNVKSMIHGEESKPLSVGKSIFDYADDLSVRVPTSCGRTGICHECVVHVASGKDALRPPTEEESFLRGDYRLACQAIVERTDQDIEFDLLRRNPQILTSGREKQIELDPVVKRDGESVVYHGEVVDRYRGSIHGIAIDVGTTTVAAELVDLETGQSRYLAAFENPQRFGGSDVMNRISYDGGKFHGELHNAIISGLNYEIDQMCRELEVKRHTIYEVVVVGNSTMRELFFGLDVQSSGQKPYKSLIEHEYLAGKRDSTSLTVGGRSLRLRISPKAKIYGAPLVASHVGADVAADLAAIDADKQDGVFMLVDVGTNTEVILGVNGRLVAASCPAGPAFEGGGVTFGITACDGAIESARWVDGRFECGVIGDATPVGICGSGLIDLMAELRRAEILSPKGRFADKANEIPVIEEQGITISRKDIGELGQAKAANYCGQYILMRQMGIGPNDIDRLYLAGGFANYVDVESAVEIGFLAPVRRDRIFKVGNAALKGAKELLISSDRRATVESLVKRIEHVELETTSDFFEIFVDGCQIKPMETG
jgi:uncharacterized 2Fe-2S/4Fe-4S cluster protein (DUF4445 family)